jgi:hypothetical protein
MSESTETFEEQWAAAQTNEARMTLLRIRFPKSNWAIKYTCRTDLMKVDLPTTKSSNPEAELTFCHGTIRTRVCEFRYCLEDSDPDNAGQWYCEECVKYKDE